MKAQMKKILYIHHGKGIGGAPLSLLYLIQHLDRTKFEPIVLFLHTSPAVELYKKHNIPIAGIVNRYDFSHTKIWWQRWYHGHRMLKIIYDTIITRYQDAPYWFKKINPDIVHLNTSSLIAWGQAAHNLKIPVVWHIREPLAVGYLGIRKSIIQHYVKTYSSAIIPISKSDATPWKNNSKTTVIYNAVDKQKFNSAILTSTQHPPTILFLGGLSEEKGTLVILKAFQQLLATLPNTRLLIAGNVDLQKLEQQPFSPSWKFYQAVSFIYHAIKGNITLLGTVHNIPELMHTSNVVVFPATVGHFARPIIEAGFMKKPVIASNLPPLDELVLNEETGFLINPQNTNQWAKKLEELLTKEELNQKMGEANYNFCTKYFDVTDQIEKIEKIYNRVSL